MNPYRSLTPPDRPLSPIGHLTLRLLGIGCIALAVALAWIFIDGIAAGALVATVGIAILLTGGGT